MSPTTKSKQLERGNGRRAEMEITLGICWQVILIKLKKNSTRETVQMERTEQNGTVPILACPISKCVKVPVVFL